MSDARVIVVTGAAQGIGLGYARRLVADGHEVVLADLNIDRAQQAAADLDGPGTAHAAHLDVSDEASCRSFAADIESSYGRLDGLVNNAAIFSTIEMKPFWELSVAEWDGLMAVNLRGPWLLTTALLSALRASDSASVVNISSDSFVMGRRGYLHYTSSKAAIVGLTNSMAHELGDFGIRVNAISPGPVYTEIDRGTVTPEQRTAMQGAQALHRDAGPDDMVGVVAFLLSADAQWVTGQVISVNGGLLHR